MSVPAIVVDDDPGVLALHRRFLERVEGVEVVASLARGEGVADAVAAHGAQLVVLDIGLPDVDGLDVLAELRERFGGDVAVVMVTAIAQRDVVQRAIRRDVDDYLVKPIELHEFVTRCRRARDLVLRRRAGRAQELAQHEIDLLMGAERTMAQDAARTALPKGFAQATLARVRAALQESEPMSAAEVAEVAGISRVSARRYLDMLVSRGELALSLRYGSTGRPEHRYGRSETTGSATTVDRDAH